MKIRITNEKSEELGNRVVDNNERLCQLIVDLTDFFLPRNKTVYVAIEINKITEKEEIIIKNKNDICDLLSMIWKEWRFEDNEYEIL